MTTQNQNEWVCRYCDTHNEAYRAQCKICGQPRSRKGNNREKTIIIILACVIIALIAVFAGVFLFKDRTTELHKSNSAVVSVAPSETAIPVQTLEPKITPVPTSEPSPEPTPEPTPIPTPAEPVQTAAPHNDDGWLTDYGKSIHSGIDYSHNEKMNIIVDAYYSRGKKEDGFTPGYYEKLARGAWQGYDVSLYFADKELYFVTVRGWGRLYYWNGEIISFKADSETENENSLDYIRFMFDGLYEIAMTYAK